MSLTTHSKIYYGHTVDSTNNAIDFNEGGPELNATLDTGEYTLEDFVTEVERALNEVGGQVYTVTVNRTTRLITISAPGTFSLLIASGSRVGTTAYTLVGFTGADLGPATSRTGDSPSGFEYVTQFILQSHVPSDKFIKSIDATVNKTASGRVEVFRYGTERFIEFNIKFATDISMPSGGPIRNNASGVSDLVALMDYLITKAPVEFMPDEDTPGTFQNVFLATTPEDSSGVGHKLKELYDRGLPGYFETGVLRFRVV
jgi:hypothetical protein